MKAIKYFLIAFILFFVSCKSLIDETFLKHWVCVKNGNWDKNYVGKKYMFFKSKIGEDDVYEFYGEGFAIQYVKLNDSTIVNRFQSPSGDSIFKYLKDKQRLVMEINGIANGMEFSETN